MFLFNLLYTLLAILQPISTKYAASGLAGVDGNLSFPEPLIFYNLTREEFTILTMEHRSTQAAKHAISDPTYLDKRWSALEAGELNNPGEFEKGILQQRNNDCEERFTDVYKRISSGRCKPSRPHSVFMRCRNKISWIMTDYWSKTCGKDSICKTTKVLNWWNKDVKVPYCQAMFPINERTSDSTAAVPTYEGHQVIPPPVPNSTPDSPPHSPSVLDHLETFWESSSPPDLNVQA